MTGHGARYAKMNGPLKMLMLPVDCLDFHLLKLLQMEAPLVREMVQFGYQMWPALGTKPRY